MKKFRATFLYLAVAALLGGYIYFFEKGPVKKTEDVKVKLFPQFVADDIVGIKLENLSTTVNALKTPIQIDKNPKDIWQITSPRKLTADESNVRSLLTQAGGFQPDDTIEKPSAISDYGLDKPGARCTFKTKSGSSFILEVGDRNVPLSAVYAQTGEMGKVYLFSAATADNIFKDINFYRDHTFFKTDTVAAQKIRVTYNGKSVVFEKKKDESWTLSDSLGARADEEKIRGLLNNISTLRIDEFVEDHPSNLSVYGLSPPHAKVEVWVHGRKSPLSIELGRGKLKSGGYFAKMGGSPTVGLIGEFFDKTLNIKAADFRDKKTLQFDASAAVKLLVERGQKTFAYVKDDKGVWSSAGRPQAPTEASNLISSLATLMISDFPPKSALTGLGNPSFTVKVVLENGISEKFSFGRKEKDDVYLSAGGKDDYLVSAGVLSQLEAYFSAVLTPQPLPSPAPPAK